MLMYQNERVGCASCIRGHRAAHCLHYNKQLISIKGQGKTANKNESLRLLFQPNPKILYENEVLIENNNGRVKAGSKRKCIHLDPNNEYEIWRVKSGKGFKLLGPVDKDGIIQKKFKINLKRNSIVHKSEVSQHSSDEYVPLSYDPSTQKIINQHETRIPMEFTTMKLHGITAVPLPTQDQKYIDEPLQAFQNPQFLKTKTGQIDQSDINLPVDYQNIINQQQLNRDHQHISSISSTDTLDNGFDNFNLTLTGQSQSANHNSHNSMFLMDQTGVSPLSNTFNDYFFNCMGSLLIQEYPHQQESFCFSELPLQATQPEQDQHKIVTSEEFIQKDFYPDILELVKEKFPSDDDLLK